MLRFSPVLFGLAILASASPLHAQVVNPNVIEFQPSPYHASVDHYDVHFYQRGSSEPFLVAGIGKPAPQADGMIRLDATGQLGGFPLPNVVAEVRIIAYGGGTHAVSGASNPFVVTPTPAPAGGGAPGAPSLSASNVSVNPITLSWTPGPGGAPTSYTLVVGSTPGAADLLIKPLGAVQTVSGAIPAGIRVYARIVAANAVGMQASNEIAVHVGASATPSLAAATVQGSTVHLSWTPAATVTVVARSAPGGAPIAMGTASGGSVAVPNVPPGVYYVTVSSDGRTESNQIVVTVP
jgi:hypothetical protein